MHKNIKLLLIGGAALVVLLIGLSILRHYDRLNAPVKLSNRLTSEILAGDSQGSYNLLASDAKKNVSADDWAALVTKLSDFFKGQPPVLQSKQTLSSIAIVKYTIKGSDGAYIMTVTLEPDGHNWQVQSFTSKLQQS